MATRLPTAEDVFGARPIPRSSRSAVSYNAGQEARAAMEAGAGLEKTGQQINRVATKLQDEADDFDGARAKADFLKKDIEIRGQLKNDPDYAKVPDKYNVFMADAREKAASIIKNPRMREKFMLDTEVDLARGQENIKGLAFEKEASTGIGLFENTLKDNMNMAMQAEDEPTRIAIFNNTNSLADSIAAKGYINPQQAMSAKRKFIEEYGETWAKTQPPEKQIELLKPKVGQGQPLKTNKEDIISYVMNDLEGGAALVKDGDGLTKWGINGKANGLSDDQVTNLTPEQANDIYKKKYWDEIGADSLPENIKLIAFDTAVNMGPQVAKDILGQSGGDPAKFMALRSEKYKAIASSNPEKAKYLKGWNNRLESVSKQAGMGGGGTYFEKTGTPVDYLSPDRKLALLNGAESEIRQKQVVARADLTQRAQDATSMAYQGVVDPNPPSETEFMNAYGDEWEKPYSQFQNVQSFATDVKNVQTLSPSEQAALLETRKPKAGEGFAVEQEQYSKLAEAVQVTNKARQEDPAAFAVRAGFLPDESASLDYSNPNKLAAQIMTQGAAVQAMQSKFGTPLLPLNKNQAEQFSKTLSSMPAANRAEYLKSMSQSIPSQEVYLATLQQIAPDNYVTAMAGSLMAKTDAKTVTGVPSSKVSERLLIGQDLINPPKVDGKETSSKFKFPDGKEFKEAFSSATEGAFRSRLGQSDQMMKTVQSYYAALANEVGDNTGVYSPELMDRAVSDILGDLPDVNGKGKVVTPWGVDENRFLDSAEVQFNKLVKENGMTEWSFGQVGLVNTAVPGEYAIDIGNSYMSDSKGRPLKIKVNGNEAAPPEPFSFTNISRNFATGPRYMEAVKNDIQKRKQGN